MEDTLLCGSSEWKVAYCVESQRQSVKICSLVSKFSVAGQGSWKDITEIIEVAVESESTINSNVARTLSSSLKTIISYATIELKTTRAR